MKSTPHVLISPIHKIINGIVGMSRRGRNNQHRVLAPAKSKTSIHVDDGVANMKSLDLTAAHIARYRGNKSGAASYTFDDGYPSSNKIAEIFEDFGWRATFYIVAGDVETRTGWDFWKPIVHKGHEVGNHSLTHTNNMARWRLSNKTLDDEINLSRALITEKLGVAPPTFAFPWHKASGRAMAIASASHHAVRKLNIRDERYAFAYLDQDHTRTLEEALLKANKQLADIAEKGGWFVASGHGVDGDGWSPVPSEFLIDHLAYAAKLSSKVWVDTYANVACYRDCRDRVSLVVKSESPSRVVVGLAGDFDPRWRTPLTIVVPIKESSNAIVWVCDAEGHAIDSAIHSGKLQFDMLPGTEVTMNVSGNE